MVPKLLDYRIGILHYLFCTYWGVGAETWSPIMRWNTLIFSQRSVHPPLTLLLIAYLWHVQGFVSKAKSMYLPFFLQLFKKNLIFNFNQYYFTYCRDSNLCDLQQPKYCSVQFCSCVRVVSACFKAIGWVWGSLYVSDDGWIIFLSGQKFFAPPLVG